MKHSFIFPDYPANEEICVSGIPFKLQRDRIILELPQADAIPFCGRCEVLFFLGMVTRSCEASDWWGPYERNYDYTKRLFIGDCVGKIHIVYEDDTQESIPVIFGVNVWNYDLFEQTKSWEQDFVKTWHGPHREPFDSDSEAERLRRAALCMMENNGQEAEKGSKWVLGIKTSPEKTLKKIILADEPCKRAGFVVSAVTGLCAGEQPETDWPVVEKGFFVRKEYARDADRLARRLYQFADELPESDLLRDVPGFDAPDVRFSGSGLADILTNVYRVNITDMVCSKIDDKGQGHTSSKELPYFGCYMGLGTWSVSERGSYYDDIWSRDVGRVMTEVAHAGYVERTARCADYLHTQLYNEATKYQVPNWKRIANVTKERESLWLSVQCKENDGHGAMMLAMYNHYLKSGAGKEWLNANKKHLFDAANWIFWQIDHPLESNFNKVLYSESEASHQIWGDYDLFSNAQCIFALNGYARMFDDMGDTTLSQKCRDTAALLWNGCLDYFRQEHFKYGKTLTDMPGDWTWEYKRFAPLFLMADTVGYDPRRDAPDLYAIMDNSFKAQKDEYYAPEAGRQMGYGQGYLTEAAILLDRYEELTECVNAAAAFCYHHTDYPYIVPEGVVLHGSKKYWFRNCDLGNAVQQGEIMKCIRLLVGIDDFSYERGLRIIPRLPDTFHSLSANGYVLSAHMSPVGRNEHISLTYERRDGGYRLTLSCSAPVKVHSVRFGPFPEDYVFAQYSGEPSHTYVLNGRKFVEIPIDRDISDWDMAVN